MITALLTIAALAAQDTTHCAALADSVKAALGREPGLVAMTAARLSKACHDDYAALFGAGRAINRAARFEEAQSDFRLREAAADLLDRAVQLQPKNAAAWFEYGLALEKRGGVQIDAFRAINHALDVADHFPDSTPPSLLAAIQLERARHEQDWIDRFRWLRRPTAAAVGTPACSNLGLFCENYTRPAAFNQRLSEASPVPVHVASERERLIGLYRLVLSLDSTQLEAAERLGREYALGEEWESLEQLAADELRRQPQARFFAAVRALAVERLGRPSEADSLFDAMVPTLVDSVRTLFAAPPPGIPSSMDFWRRSRPLWLAPYNELRLAYWARVTYAILVFGDREAGVVGTETPEGDALLRYGWPKAIAQVSREQGTILSPNDMAALIATALDCAPDPGNFNGGGNQGIRRCGASDPGYNKDPGGGRWIIWTYEMDRPSLIFEQRPGRRVPHYVFGGAAETYATELRKASPLTFTSKLAPRHVQLPVQAARFRSELAGATTIALFALVPAAQMDVPEGDSLTAGLFVFRDTAGFPSIAHQAGRFQAGQGLSLAYKVPVGPGRYAFSLEAYAANTGAAATARDSFVAPSWDPDSLETSDLLIAHQATANGAGIPLTWRDLLIQPSRSLTVVPGSTLWLVWEVYGLKAGAKGVGEFHVTLALQDVNRQSLPLRLLSRLGVGARAGPSPISLEWDAEQPLSADGRALQFVSVQLPEEARGDYNLMVTVSDSTHRTARAVRHIALVVPERSH
jgi:tetratricopeptide (TPR) repeat protein